MSQSTLNYYDIEQAIAGIVDKYGAKPMSLIMVLQDVQRHYRYLPKDALKMVAKKMDLPIAQIYSVATFYRAFSLKPKGKNHICVCTGTACHVRQAEVIVNRLETVLGIKAGETTTDQGFSLETVNCLGACALGPLVTANETYHGNMTATKVERMLDELSGKKSSGENIEEDEV
jgi:NADH:ubiquinone oxidoreductase subunit E